MGAGRWDRTLIRKILAKNWNDREKVEALLHAGEMTGQAIARKFGWPKSTWVSAVKKNPIPGGVLDPKAKLAKHEGEWIDNAGIVQPWKGLDKKTKLPVRTVAPKVKPKEPKTPAKVLGFIRSGSREEPQKADNQPPPGADGAPFAAHAGVASTPPDPSDLDEPMDDDQGTTRTRNAVKGQLAQMRRMVNKLMPLKEHVELLVKHARNVGESSSSMKALDTLAEIRGIAKAVKDPGAAALGASSLFQLPRGSMPGLAPVGTVPLASDAVVQGPGLGGDHAEDADAAVNDAPLHEGTEDAAPREGGTGASSEEDADEDLDEPEE